MPPRILCIEKLCSGTLSSTAIHPREIVKKVLTHKSNAIVFAHNHPSGKTDPSREDYAITTKLAIALARTAGSSCAWDNGSTTGNG